jgi:hypothetical protein
MHLDEVEQAMQRQAQTQNRSQNVSTSGTGWFSGAPLSKLLLITAGGTYIFPRNSLGKSLELGKAKKVS